MKESNISQTQVNGNECYVISIGKATYYFMYSSEICGMPKIIQVTIDGVVIPVEYEVSDVVEYATSYAIGLDEGKLYGILVCIEEVNKKTFPIRGIINAIDDAIAQAMRKGCFDHDWRSLSCEETATLANEIMSHSQTIKS